ncbi:MAG: hypothetical protein AAF171_26270, partial [Cyanobacteria bacterium P01_A01_bin.116]
MPSSQSLRFRYFRLSSYKLSKQNSLTKKEENVFIDLFFFEKTRLEVIDNLHISPASLKNTLTEIYKKFGIPGQGPGKESDLRKKLKTMEDLWKGQEQSDGSYTLENFPPLLDDLSFTDKIRQSCGNKILNQYSRIRLYNNSEVDISELYVDVYLLSQSRKDVFISKEKLLETFNFREDRIGLPPRVKRISGIDAANRNPNLLILGKPGAGKTTFLKRIAVDCVNGIFQPDLIPVFVELRKIKSPKWNLLDFLDQSI